MNSWDGVWVTDGQTLVIKDGGLVMYHVNNDGVGLSISVMQDEISDSQIHSIISDPNFSYRAEYDLKLSGDTLNFVHIYYGPNGPVTVKDSGDYTRTDRDPYTEYNVLRNKPSTQAPAAEPVLVEDQTAELDLPEVPAENLIAERLALTAFPTTSNVLVNGETVAFEAYNIDGSNYFKLRDFAYAINGSEKQFEVSWDGDNDAIALISGAPYTAVGGELEVGDSTDEKTPVSTASKIMLDETEITLTAYNIDGNNYFKLRDMGLAFDFGIGWNEAESLITIDTGIGYTK